MKAKNTQLLKENKPKFMYVLSGFRYTTCGAIGIFQDVNVALNYYDVLRGEWKHDRRNDKWYNDKKAEINGGCYAGFKVEKIEVLDK